MNTAVKRYVRVRETDYTKARESLRKLYTKTD